MNQYSSSFCSYSL